MPDNFKAEANSTLNGDDICPSLFLNMPNGVAYCRVIIEDGKPKDGLFLMINRAFIEQTGLKDVVGKRISEIVPNLHEIDPDAFDRCVRVALTGKDEQFERLSKATQQWYQISVYSPKPEHFVAIFENITEQKMAEASSRLAEQRYVRVIEGSDQSFWDWNLKSNEFRVSQRFKAMLGYDEGRLPGHDDREILISPEQWSTYVHPDDLAKAWKSIDQHLKGLTPSHEVEVRCKTKSGEWTWLLTKGRVVVKDQDGSPLIMSGTFTSIQKRKRAEETLRKSEERLRAALINSRVAVFEQDLELRYTYVQQPSFDLSPEQVIGKHDHDLFEPGTVAELDAIKQSVIDTGVSVRKELSAAAIGQRIHYFDLYVEPRRNATGQIIGILCTATDITEREKAHERERRLKSIYHALSDTNDVIIHQLDEKALFAKVCQIAVECGGMLLAWIGVADRSRRNIVTVANYGTAGAYSDGIEIITSPDKPEGRGPIGVSYREKCVVVLNDFGTDERVAPWHDRARQYGIGSIATFPILRNGEPYAVFSIYSEQIGAFDDEIVDLFDGMAKNISFALDNLTREIARNKAETALKKSEASLKRVFNSGVLGVFYWKENGEVTSANNKYLEIIGYSRRDLQLGKINWVSMTPPEWHGIDKQYLEDLKSGVENPPYEKEYFHKDGTRISVLVAGTMLGKDNGVAFLIDNSESKRAHEELRLAAMVYQDSSEGMMVTDASNRIISVNPAFEHITGYAADEVLGKSPNILKSGRHDEEFYRAMWKSINSTGRWQGEVWNRGKNGEEYAELITINTTFNPDSSVFRRVALFSDITKKKESDDLIWHQANFDALTGLPNRNLFRDHLRHEIRKVRRTNLPMALMFLDLDGFKDVNDTLGHDMGDLLLKGAAERLNGCLREIDTVARLGGDEFTVILSELHDPSNVDRVARHILEKLSDPFQLGEETAYVSASIGITLFPEDAIEVEDLIKNADQAMYAAKQRGRNQYQYFTPSMQEMAIARMKLVNDLRTALENEQFEIVYQPIVELSSGSIHKAEALIRWQHPTKGLINPVEFISTAEDTGMITSFGNWVFHEATKQAALWREKYHPDFQISINISPVQFRKEGINPTIWLDHLKGLNLPGQGIVVEITEGLLLDASPKVTDQLLMLRDAGIEVSLDDFGTGYSSLSYLKKFDIDYIKIDQSFVRNLTPDSDDMALCEAMIVMAHKLGIKVIAEGVESRKQHELLANGGCDFAQGYYFTKPVSGAEFEHLLKVNPFASQKSLSI